MHMILLSRKKKALRKCNSQDAILRILFFSIVIFVLLFVLLSAFIRQDKQWEISQYLRLNKAGKITIQQLYKNISKQDFSMLFHDDRIDDYSINNHLDDNEKDTQRLLKNGWIPEGDVVNHYQFKKSHELQNIFSQWRSLHRNQTEEEKEIDKIMYNPSLESYPLNMLKDIDEPLKDSDIIFYWHIPKAGGSTMKRIFTHCFNFTRSDQYVDLTTTVGISQAKKQRVVDQNFLDVIVGSHLHETSALFSDEHKGRLMTVMRHPIELVASLFYYLGHKGTWERHYRAELANMTLSEYANSKLMMDNWMTRYLSRKLRGNLTESDLSLAKSILEKKAVIGMIDQMDHSLQIFQNYFGLQPIPHRKSCVHRLVHNEHINKNEHHIKVLPGSQEWKILEERNSFDLQLYKYARLIFQRQASRLMHK